MGGELCIVDGRHATLETFLKGPCVPNSVNLSSKGTRAMIITGPNMNGKSTFIRQIALIVLMTHIGSFVPATSASMTVFDGIYSRMGASDNLAAGKSTFLVEMQEASEILDRATPRSLVILDELGRGTATFDGTALAYAALKNLAQRRCLTLFVTHYPHLSELETEILPSKAIQTFHMDYLTSQDEDGDEKISFLYKITSGAPHRSYGLNVAKLAGIPKNVIRRAAEKSLEFEQSLPLSLRTRTITSNE
nr:DNA mismatch repair protein MSH3 [Paratrimastix eleionoma]